MDDSKASGHIHHLLCEDEEQLRRRIALALHHTPGFHEGATSPWIAAQRVIEELLKPREETA